jgi:nitroimidazol reductase NimA-like FMN-containing flavoprotein (pyridoxamine 5'-phosphate oxidase superfamily)
MFVAEMQRNESLEFLGRRRLAHLACAHDDQPYVVPIYVVLERDWLYGFSTVGRKIDWLRENPRVCVQSEEIVDEEHWTSVIVLGRFQELTDSGDLDEARRAAHLALGRHASWWASAYLRKAIDTEERALDPVYFRVFVDTITGRRTTSSV